MKNGEKGNAWKELALRYGIILIMMAIGLILLWSMSQSDLISESGITNGERTYYPFNLEFHWSVLKGAAGAILMAFAEMILLKKNRIVASVSVVGSAMTFFCYRDIQKSSNVAWMLTDNMFFQRLYQLKTYLADDLLPIDMLLKLVPLYLLLFVILFGFLESICRIKGFFMLSRKLTKVRMIISVVSVPIFLVWLVSKAFTNRWYIACTIIIVFLVIMIGKVVGGKWQTDLGKIEPNIHSGKKVKQ